MDEFWYDCGGMRREADHCNLCYSNLNPIKNFEATRSWKQNREPDKQHKGTNQISSTSQQFLDASKDGHAETDGCCSSSSSRCCSDPVRLMKARAPPVSTVVFSMLAGSGWLQCKNGSVQNYTCVTVNSSGEVKTLGSSASERLTDEQFIEDGTILSANLRGSSNGWKKTLADVPKMHPPLAKELVKGDCLDDKKIVLKVTRDKQPLLNSKVDTKQGISGSSCRPTKTMIPLLRACWAWVFLFVMLLLTSGVNPSEDDPSFKQGSCRFDLTSVATFSCVRPNSEWRQSSATCCKTLLYAIDHVPLSGERGACCLCRYMGAKNLSSKLVTTYVRCKGKDRHAVTKWSSFPIKTCSIACGKQNNPFIDMGTSARKDHPVVHGASNDIFKILWIAASIAFVMGFICFRYFWRFKATANPSEQRRGLSLDGDARGRRRKYSSRSSTELKGRRSSMSRSSPNS